MIISSEILEIEDLENDNIRVIERHINNVGALRDIIYITNVSSDLQSLLSQHAIEANLSDIQEEIDSAILAYASLQDPLHTEVSSNNWQKKEPDFQSWDDLASPVLIHYLSIPSKIDLRFIESTITRISSKDKKTLLGMTSQEVSSVNGDIQEAVNIQADLDLYTPYFVDGIKV